MGRGKCCLTVILITYETEIEIEARSETIAKFEAFGVHGVEKNQIHSGENMSYKRAIVVSLVFD